MTRWILVVALFFFTTDAFTAAGDGNNAEAIWLSLTALNLVLCTGLSIAIDRAAEDRAHKVGLRRS